MIDVAKYRKRLDIKYARYLKLKRADRFTALDGITYAERHSEKVSWLKRFIFRMVILLIILLIVWPLAKGKLSDSKINFSKGKGAEDRNIEDNIDNLPVIMKPSFFGNDNNGQPFNIIAGSGVSVSEAKVVLNNISANMSLKNNSRVSLSSSHGSYFTKKKRLVLNRGVTITTDAGYKFNTESALVQTEENMATGSELVRITGKLGNIDAQGFIIRNSGDEILLFGGVDLNTQPATADLTDGR